MKLHTAAIPVHGLGIGLLLPNALSAIPHDAVSIFALVLIVASVAAVFWFGRPGKDGGGA